MRISYCALAVLISATLVAGPTMAQRVGGTGGGGILDRPGAKTMNNFNPADDRDPFNRGLRAYDAGDYVLAERMFSEVLSLSPNDATVLVLYGMTYSGMGNYRSARRELAHALRVDRDNVDGHREMGVATAKLGDGKAADGELKALQALQKTCAGACADAAKLERAVGAVQAAIAAGPVAKAG